MGRLFFRAEFLCQRSRGFDLPSVIYLALQPVDVRKHRVAIDALRTRRGHASARSDTLVGESFIRPTFRGSAQKLLNRYIPEDLRISTLKAGILSEILSC